MRELRRGVTIPMVFMTYANVVFSYGTERFLSNCRDVGIDGLILPDVPYEEKEEFLPACRRYGVDFISLIAPTSENRIAMIAREAEGFLYIVSSLGVTGERSEIKTDLASIVSLVRENTDIPCAIGFGISTPEQAKKMADLSDGAIVGSAIVKLLAQYSKDAPEHIRCVCKRNEGRAAVKTGKRGLCFDAEAPFLHKYALSSRHSTENVSPKAETLLTVSGSRISSIRKQ